MALHLPFRLFPSVYHTSFFQPLLDPLNTTIISITITTTTFAETHKRQHSSQSRRLLRNCFIESVAPMFYTHHTRRQTQSHLPLPPYLRDTTCTYSLPSMTPIENSRRTTSSCPKFAGIHLPCPSAASKFVLPTTSTLHLVQDRSICAHNCSASRTMACLAQESALNTKQDGNHFANN